MSIEGRLTIAVQAQSNQVKQVAIQSSRPVYVASVFKGNTVAEALNFLPMLFSVCGMAQACAGARACEQAQGIKAPPYTEAIRDCLVTMETVREHLWRILLDWPQFLGEPPQKHALTELLKVQKDYRQALTSEHNPFLPHEDIPVYESERVQPVVQKIIDILAQTVFAVPPAQWLQLKNVNELEQWIQSQQTIAARFLALIMQKQWQTVGCCNIKALPVIESDKLYPLLAEDDFISLPQWQDECCETSSLTRTDSPLLQDLQQQYGNGLLVRLVARLTEMAQLAGKLLVAIKAASTDFPVIAMSQQAQSDSGIGQVAAARGQLVHYVSLKHDTVADYQILAPTEWNFHPQGIAARSLETLQGNTLQIEQQARLLINAIDPCVGFDLGINDA